MSGQELYDYKIMVLKDFIEGGKLRDKLDDKMKRKVKVNVNIKLDRKFSSKNPSGATKNFPSHFF